MRTADNEPPPRYLIGCVLLLCAPFVPFLAIGAVFGVTFQLASPDPTVPHPIVLALMSGAILGALCAFFIMVTKRLFAAYRGREVQRLMPEWLSVTLAAALGVGGLASLAFPVVRRSPAAAGASVTFLLYAADSIRRWRHRSAQKQGCA